MAELYISDTTVREYLLGRVSDETMLETIEEKLFADEEFCSQVALAEDGLINDYVRGHMNATDAGSFQSTLATDSERRVKVELTQALRERSLARDKALKPARSSVMASLAAFFRQPQYAGAFAVLLIGVLILAVYLTRKNTHGDLAELRSVYRQSRPTETRISEFDYAPLTQLRGAPEPSEQTRLRRIENNLIEAAENNPSGETFHALGIFYLTQQKYSEATRQFESALKRSGQNAKLYNDIGVAHFEMAKTKPADNRLEDWSKSLEAFTRATEIDGSLLEALFNKSRALQEMGLPREAVESWRLYLQKDPSSGWAEEARKNLARIESERTRFKSDEEVLSDFLTAYRAGDKSRAQKIHNETKGLLNSTAVPLQLSRKYLLAKQSGSEVEAKESLEALTYIGNFERSQNGDAFFFDLANFYEHLGAEKRQPLLQAKASFDSGLRLVSSGDVAGAISEFEKSGDLFSRLGDDCEAAIAAIWTAQLLPDIAKVAESRRRLEAIIANAESRKFLVLLPPAYYWLGISDRHQNRISATSKNLKTALRLAEAGKNAFEIQHAQQALAFNYSDLGELEPALFYASKVLTDRGPYYQHESQNWRDKITLADLSLKLTFFSTSLSLSRESLSMIQEASPDSSRVNDSLRFMVSAATAKQDFTAALNYAGQSMQIALKRGDSAENTRTIAEIYLLLADLKSRAKSCNEALMDYDMALEMYRRLPEVTASLYQIHKGRLFCFEQLDRQPEFSGELKTVLKLSEKYRTTIREDDSRQAFFATDQAVFDAAAANAIKMHDSRGAFEFVEASKSRSLLDFVASPKSIAEVEESFGPVARPLSVTEIQARLPEQVQLVKYAVLPDRLAIWIVSKTRFDLITKQITAAELENKTDAYQGLIAGKGPLSEIKQAGHDLYQLLIPPDLASEKQLCLVPDKFLHQLSFATLVSPAGRYLLEDYALFNSPSASILVLATENARRKEQVINESVLSIGNPDFDREDNPTLADLPDAESEARVIASAYSKPVELLGSEATKEKFLDNFTAAEVVHFAGHFVANRQSPGNSKLLFAGGDLRSTELSSYKLPKAKLLLLSACQTGLERYNKSEGAIGIARTLLALGAPLVVASQWKVDSEPTKNLMIAFHRNRKQKGMTSAESLRQAQLEMLSKNETSGPFYWAGFSLFGGYANY